MNGKNAVVFAGQGAQFIGMGKDLSEAYPECRSLFEKADTALGYRLSDLCFEGPGEELTKSNHCQPAIFVVSAACFHALRKTAPNVEFCGAGGLSLGEWTALHIAGALTYEDTLRILAARGRFMQAACEERDGTMVSVIGLTEEKLRDICSATGVEIANLNSAEQIVLSGARQGIVEAEKLCKEAGAKRTIPLKVAGAFHSTLMASAARNLEEFLGNVEIRPPSMPVTANVTGRPHEDAEAIRNAMVKQVTSPVRWLDCVQWFGRQGVTTYFECGPGKVLSGLIKRIDMNAGVFNIQGIQDCRCIGNPG